MVVSFEGYEPSVAQDAWVAPGVTLIGRVRLDAQSSVWYTSVLRGDNDEIRLGARSNLQDGCVAHADPGFPVSVGRGVSVGHRVVLHGCTVDDDVLVGMGAVLLNGCRVGTESLVAAGTVLLEGADIPPRSLVAGVPGKVRRELTDAELERVRRNATSYVERARKYAAM